MGGLNVGGDIYSVVRDTKHDLIVDGRINTNGLDTSGTINASSLSATGVVATNIHADYVNLGSGKIYTSASGSNLDLVVIGVVYANELAASGALTADSATIPGPIQAGAWR